MMRVTARALSVFCPHCQTRVNLEDMRIVGSHPGKKLATSGDILVEPGARLNLELIGNRIVVNGRVNGAVSANEFVEIGPSGLIIGNIKAPKLVVRDGGSIQGRFERTTAPQEGIVNEADPIHSPDSAASGADTIGDKSPPDSEETPQRARPRPMRPPGF